MITSNVTIAYTVNGGPPTGLIGSLSPLSSSNYPFVIPISYQRRIRVSAGVAYRLAIIAQKDSSSQIGTATSVEVRVEMIKR